MKNKYAYITPEIKVNVIELEQGIATGSSSIRPEGSVSEQWTVGESDSRNLDW